MHEPLHGHNGWPTPTPGKMWLATSVFGTSSTAPKATDIYPDHAGPQITPEEKPWFSSQELTILNAYNSKENVHRRSVMREYECSYWNSILHPMEELLYREPVYIAKYRNTPGDFQEGGWLPLDHQPSYSSSQTMREVWLRQQAKASRNFSEADLIRKVLLGGQVQILDFPNGTMWFYKTPFHNPTR